LKFAVAHPFKLRVLPGKTELILKLLIVKEFKWWI